MEYTTKQIFSIIRKKAQKFLIKGFVYWFYPHEKKSIHISTSRKIGNAVFRNRIRRIVKNYIGNNKRFPKGVYIFLALRGCSIKKAKGVKSLEKKIHVFYKIINRLYMSNKK